MEIDHKDHASWWGAELQRRLHAFLSDPTGNGGVMLEMVKQYQEWASYNPQKLPKIS